MVDLKNLFTLHSLLLLMKFNHLLSSIQQTHDALQRQSVAAINRSLIIRNWLIGFYIVEFEQKGEDRARYGDALLESLSSGLKKKGLTNINERELRRFRAFYLIYPYLFRAFDLETLTLAIRGTVSPVFDKQILGTLPQELSASENQHLAIVQAVSEQLLVPPDKILNRLSFSHIAELLPIDNPLKRAFYEIECIKGTWSVRELKRQINSLYFERSGLNKTH